MLLENEMIKVIDNYLESEVLCKGKEDGNLYKYKACVSYADVYEISILNVGFQIVFQELTELNNWFVGRSFL